MMARARAPTRGEQHQQVDPCLLLFSIWTNSDVIFAKKKKVMFFASMWTNNYTKQEADALFDKFYCAWMDAIDSCF